MRSSAMRPKDLKYPFQGKKKHVLVADRVLYVPQEEQNESEDVAFPNWSDPSIFEAQRPVCIEYCSGNGDWIANRARLESQCNWIAVEKKFDRVRKIWSKIKNGALPNLLAVCAEGFALTKRWIPDEAVQAVYINFPDPWPKRRHAKNRIVQDLFIAELRRILLVNGTLTIATDDPVYSEAILALMRQTAGFESLFPHPFYATEYGDYGSSYFEALWREKGKCIYYHSFKKMEAT